MYDTIVSYKCDELYKYVVVETKNGVIQMSFTDILHNYLTAEKNRYMQPIRIKWVDGKAIIIEAEHV